MKFSANLGFLWNDRPLPEAIHAAHAAGFDAVECHWPYDNRVDDVAAALRDTGLRMLGLNTRRGYVAGGENGLAALRGREDEARAAIDEAIAYARVLKTPNVHVMAGVAEGAEAHQSFVTALGYACEKAAPFGITILIEPLNIFDAPGYFLTQTDQAAQIIAQVGADNLKLMFDCYHVQRMEGDAMQKLPRLLPLIGHIQFASVPERGAPDRGKLNYGEVFALIAELGYCAPLGAEYKPGGDTDASLGWLTAMR